jgi:cell wall assembly regulator SMI1
MKEIWERIETWLSTHAPEPLATLNVGATQQQLEHLEQTLGYVLPDDLRASVKIHNGQRHSANGLINGWELLSVERMLEQWTFLKEFYDADEFVDNSVTVKGNVANEWWSPMWLPVTDNGNGDYHCIDLTPGSSCGQILMFWHDWGERKVESSSFKLWLGDFVAELEAGMVEMKIMGRLERKARRQTTKV